MSIVPKNGSLTLQESRISFQEWGTGDRSVLLLHGNPGRKSDFDRLCELLAADGFRCLVPDRPGHGNSEELIPEEPDPWLDATVYAELIEQKCHGAAYVVGYSLGAFLAFKLAARSPDRVKGLGLVAPFLQPPDPFEKPSSIPGLSRNAMIGTFLGMLLPTLASGKLRAHLARVWEPRTIPEDVLDREMSWYSRFESLVATINDKNDMLRILGDVHGNMCEFARPVLMVAGKQDKVCNAQAQHDRLIGAVKNATVAWIEDGGHGLPFTHAPEIAALIKKHYP